MKKIHKPIKKNCFEVFNLPLSYEINISKLEQDLFKLQKKFHPDKFMNRSKEEIFSAQHHSSVINSAYECLVDPVKRGYELLKILGFSNINQDENSFKDQSVLLEVMELQQETENINSEKEKNEFINKIDEKILKLLDELNIKFIEKNLIEANSINTRVSYLIKIITNLKDTKDFKI